MPWFYFDLLDGEKLGVDDEGVECESPEAARKEAAITLGEIMRDAMPDGDQRTMALRIRGESGQIVLMLSLVFTVQHVAA
jgi:hypothetical protein